MPAVRACPTSRRSRRLAVLPCAALVAVFAVAASACLPVSGGTAGGTTAGTSSTVTRSAAADTYVAQTAPTKNFGTSTALRIDTSPTIMRSYVRFAVGSLPAAVTKATLRVYATTSANSGLTVSNVTGSWSETGTTYANAPAPGAVAGTTGKVTAGTWSAVDVTKFVRAGTNVSFVLTGIGTTAIGVASHEAGANGPRLVIETGTATTTTTPAATTTAAPGTTAAPTTTVTPTTSTTTTVPSGPDLQPSFPMRGAFYYPWYPNSWTQSGIFPWTNYQPSAGYYDGGDIAVVRQQIQAMQYGKIQMAISSWWGQGHATDTKLKTLMRAADGTTFRWSVYYEHEGFADPTVAELQSDLQYLTTTYGSDPSALRIGGRLVVFAYADGADGCGMVDRWKAANTVGAYVVLKVFPGYATCANQPDEWHQYAPAGAADRQTTHSYTISPGFWMYGQSVRLARDLTRWNQNVRDMVASGAKFQLVTTFNEWGEGTAVESGTLWPSSSGHGAYLDALHLDGVAPSSADPRIAAVGDSACDPASGSFNGGAGTATACRQMAVSDLVVGKGYAAFLGLGDLQYENGTYDAFTKSYGPSWGRVLSISRPAPGNHEYNTANGAGYYQYFGSVAGDPTKGYYSYDIGQWHIVALNTNSNCGAVACGKGSAQEQWLRADLAAHPTQCSLVYWHHPRFSSGEHGSNTVPTALFQAADELGVDVILNGHDHHYERFAPQTAAGVADPNGVREFVVGTGGKSHYLATTTVANSEVTSTDTYGILELTLHPAGYDWRFVAEAGSTTGFTDAGTQACT